MIVPGINQGFCICSFFCLECTSILKSSTNYPWLYPAYLSSNASSTLKPFLNPFITFSLPVEVSHNITYISSNSYLLISVLSFWTWVLSFCMELTELKCQEINSSGGKKKSNGESWWINKSTLVPPGWTTLIFWNLPDISNKSTSKLSIIRICSLI